jgi:hypothetical protein
MALQVWLPLSGSTINLGLNSLVANAVGDIMYAAGLFGGTSFNAGSGSIAMPIASIPEKLSLSVWFKQQVSASNSTFVVFGGNGDRIDYAGATGAFIWNNEGVGMLPAGTTLFTLAPDGEWHHLVITADGSKVTVFVDGVQVFTDDQDDANEAAFGSDATIYIGAKSDGTNKWVGYIQDFKLFDTIISLREIKDISKALMLEYTFNHNGFGNENLLTGSERSYTVSGEDFVNKLENDHVYAQLAAGTYTLSAKTTGFWSATNETGGVVLTGDPEDMPCGLELYTKSGDTISGRTFYDLSTGGAVITITNPGTYYVGMIVYGDKLITASATISDIKLEQGTKATPWLPNKSHQMYSDMQIGTVEQDTSGNDLDGVISATPPAWSGDSALFSGSYDFSNGSYIESPALNLTNVSQFTVSVWFKGSTLSDKVLYGFDSGSKFNLAGAGGVFCIKDEANDATRVFGEGISVADYADNAWHQFVVTGDGSVEKLYIDGEFKGNASAYVAFGLSKMLVNGTGSGNRPNGLMSDFRIYSKALTADEINALYHQKAAIDNTGKVFGAEFIAGVTVATRFVTKTGVINTAELTTFDTPIDTESTETDDASVFKFGRDKIVATEVIES